MNKRSYALSSTETVPVTVPILLCGGICAHIKTTTALGHQGLGVHMREDTLVNREMER
jgi:hypothetical protein